MRKPKISLVVISHNMERELKRTLYTLRAPYQRNIDNSDIEIIVVDNGSNVPVQIESSWNNVCLLHQKNPTQSPVPAVNYGLANVTADLVGVMIDGARMASPKLLSYALMASNISSRIIMTTMGYHLGPEVQMKSVEKGYNQAVEDDLLSSIPWVNDGYRLFDISVFAGSSSKGWFNPIAESNALFMFRNMWRELGGYDEGFKTPGGGLANLDILLRANDLTETVLVSLLGEGTFHQVHGGVATNQKRTDASWDVFHEEYMMLRNKPFMPSERKALLFGSIESRHKKCLTESLRRLS